MKEITLANFDFADTITRVDVCQDDGFAYDHFRVNDGAATVAAGRVGDKLYLSVAFCSPKDNFSRRFGRNLAAMYFMDGRSSNRRAIVDVADVKDQPPPVVLLHGLIAYLERGKGVPQWARNAVTVWFRGERRHERHERKCQET